MLFASIDLMEFWLTKQKGGTQGAALFSLYRVILMDLFYNARAMLAKATTIIAIETPAIAPSECSSAFMSSC